LGVIITDASGLSIHFGQNSGLTRSLPAGNPGEKAYLCRRMRVIYYDMYPAHAPLRRVSMMRLVGSELFEGVAFPISPCRACLMAIFSEVQMEPEPS